MTRGARLLVAMLVASSAAAACSAGSQVIVRPPSTRASSSLAPTATASVTINPRVVARPHAGLRNGESVTVTAMGFGPDQGLLALQCGVKGGSTGEGDCDLGNLASLSTNADGVGTTKLTVHTGRIGANADLCDRSHPCLVSVSQATLNPTQSATTRVTFS